MSTRFRPPAGGPSLAVLTAFCEAARHGSFVAAARALAITPSAISKAVSVLEAQWGVVLFRRTGRECSLTLTGETIYKELEVALFQLAKATFNAANLKGTVGGRLTVSAPAAYAQSNIARMLLKYSSAHPDVRVDIRAENRFANLLDGSTDLAIRVGLQLPDSSLRAVRLGGHRLWTVAAPLWVKQLSAEFDWPRLARVPGVCFRKAETGQVEPWRFKFSRTTEERLPPLLTVMDDNLTMLSWCIYGGGVTQLPDYAVRGAVARGDLVRLWPATEVSASGIHAVFAEHGRNNPALRAFVSHLKVAQSEDENSGV